MATILCIEDEDYLLEDIAEFIEISGHDALKAIDGQMGLEMILKHKPNLVISDVSMPKKDGKQMLIELRSSYPEFNDTPFIFLSAFSERQNILEGMDIGADDYLTKPIDYDLLERTIAARLRRVHGVKKKSNEDLLHLYKDLTCEPNDQEKRPPISSQITSKKQLANRPKPQVAKNRSRKKKVYGSVLELKNAEVIEKKSTNEKGLLTWLEDTSRHLLDQLFPDKGTVAKSSKGKIVVCYNDSDKDMTTKRTDKLVSNVNEKLHQEKIPDLKKSKIHSEKDLNELTVVADKSYEAEISEEDVSPPERFAAKIQEDLDNFDETNSAKLPSEMIDLLSENDAQLVLLKLCDQNKKALPIRIFNFDENSRKIISTSFKNFTTSELLEAQYKLDVLFLTLIEKHLNKPIKNKMLIIDVHCDTLLSDIYRKLYLAHLKDFMRISKDKIILNLRKIPPKTPVGTYKEITKSFANITKIVIGQLEPRDLNDFIKSPLPLGGIICSYLNTQFGDLNAVLLKKTRAALPNSKIPLIVRGVQSYEEIPTLHRLGFNGFGMNPDS